MKKAVLYTRVSSSGSKADRQDNQRQVNDLQAFAQKQSLEVIEVISEKISGSKSIEERKGIQRLLELAKSKKINKVLVAEPSRLFRNYFEAEKLIHTLTELKVSLVIQSLNIETLDNEGKRNSIMALVLSILNQFAQIEKEWLVDRIKSGQQLAITKGKTCHRPKGSKESLEKFLSKHKSAAKDLRSGLSLNKTAKIHDISVPTVIKIRRAISSSLKQD